MATVTYDKDVTALLVIDPYNDFISEGGKLWGRLKAVAEANSCVPHMSQVLNAARKAGLRVFHVLHHRYRPGDYETWKYIAPVQKAAWLGKSFKHGTWDGEIRSEFAPQTGEIDEPPAKIVIDPPLAEPLASRGVVVIQYCSENLHIVPVFGPNALAVSPRVGHLCHSRKVCGRKASLTRTKL